MPKLPPSGSDDKPPTRRDPKVWRVARLLLPLIALVATISSLELLSQSAIAGEDPLEWRPPSSKPQFRKLLADTEYKRLSSPILGGLTRARGEAAKLVPDHGLKISGVFAPGALEAQGVTLNDVITKVDSDDLWGRYTQSSDKPIRVRVYSARQNAFREIKVITDLGFAFSIHRRPDLTYLRGRSQNPKWDADTFIALVAASSDPNLAETAWYHALAAGSPRNRLCLASAAQLALAQGRPDSALDFWYEAEHTAGLEPLDPLLAYRVMIANYKLEQARDLARKYPKLLPNMASGFETLVALHHARSPQERTAPAPSAQARTMHRRDARGELIGLSPLAENPFLYTLTSRDTYHNQANSDHFALFEFQIPQGLTNFELGLTFTMAPTDKRRAGFVKLARVILNGARNGDHQDGAEAPPIGHVELEIPSGFSIENTEPGEGIYFPDPSVAADGKLPHSVRFVSVGGQIEVFLDNHRILYQPTVPDLRLQSLRFQLVGASVDFSDFTLEELIPRL